MTAMRHGVLAVVFAMAAMLGWAAAPAPALADKVLKLSPADPQPDAAAIRPGLEVKYSYPADIKTLHQAESWRKYKPKPGPPLVGYDYPDTLEGEKALTSESDQYVVAFIKGYIRFDQPGTYQLEFWSNDGVRVHIGGAQVYEHDLRHPCETLGPTTVEVPQAGWYATEALWFQRRVTSCLLMKWAPPGGALDWAPTEIYGFVPE